MISVIIPTQNMASYIAPLFESFVTSGFAKFISEYIVINDGSMDDTEAVLNHLKKQDPWRDLIIISNSPAQGRFLARYKGAQLSKNQLICFLDSRIILPSDLGSSLEHLLKRERFIMGVPTIDIKKSIFSLYWERSHEWIFRRHYRDVREGFYLNTENYEQYAKGTGMLLLEREAFVEGCKAIADIEVLADDTLLIREIVKKNPIYVTTMFRFGWEPRQEIKEFLWRLIDRGPGFVEYNFIQKRNRFFYASIFAISIAVLIIAIATSLSGSILLGILLLFFLTGLSVILIAKSLWEFVRLMPLHLLVVGCFSVGVCYGLFFHVRKYFMKNSISE